MKPHSLSKEQRILIALRKTLAEVVKDTTPLPGRRHPLQKSTIERIRDCFSLISARERELAQGGAHDGAHDSDISAMRPRYADEARTPEVVPLQYAGKPRQGPQNR